MFVTLICSVSFLFLIILLCILSWSLPVFYCLQSELLVSTRKYFLEWNLIQTCWEIKGISWRKNGQQQKEARQSVNSKNHVPTLAPGGLLLALLCGNATVHTDRVIGVGAGCICWNLHIVPWLPWQLKCSFPSPFFSLTPNSKSSVDGFQLPNLHCNSPHCSC